MDDRLTRIMQWNAEILAMDWSAYDDCSLCKQGRGKPCRNQQYPLDHPVVYRRVAHGVRGRIDRLW